MATLNELYPSYYNVLAKPPISNLASTTDQLSEIAEETKKAWEQFQKTGAFSLEALKQGFSAANGGAFNYLKLLQSGISLAGSFVPGGSFVAPILNMVIGWLWPNKKKDDSKALIDLIDKEVQKELNKALSEQDKNNWLGFLLSIFENSNKVNNALIDAQWSGTADDTNRQTVTPTDSDYINVGIKFDAADASIIGAQNQIMNGNFDAAASSYFVIGATVRLALYQSYIRFCNQWIDQVGFNSANYKTQTDNLTRAKETMRDTITNYTEKIRTVFKDNLPKLDSTKFGINAYNVYVKGMTINVLDMVATWPSLYPNDYDSQTQLEQTRVIFSNMVGQEQGTDGTVKIYNTFDSGSYQHGQINNNNVDLISYFPDELRNLQLAVYTPKGGSGYAYPYGFVLNYKNSASAYKYGNNDPSGGLPTISAPIQQINAETQHSKYLDGEKINGIGAGLPGYCTTQCSEIEKPFSCTSTANGYKASCNSVYSSQKINALYPFTQTGVQGSQGKLGVMASHVPYDLDPINRIGQVDPDTNNIILKGIPAEKGTLDNDTRPSVVKEWMNGANAVKLSLNQTLKMVVSNETPLKYKIRLRYATQGDEAASILFRLISPHNSDLTNENHFFLAPSNKQVNVQGENGNYILNTVIDSIDLPLGQQTILIQNISPQDLFLDRIEFVPIPGSAPTLSYNDCQDLIDLCTDYGDEDSCKKYDAANCSAYFSDFFVTLNDLQQISQLVNELFDSSSHTELASTVTDYWIDQVVMKVDALSDEVFAIEKKALRKLVNKAKQLSRDRNVLVGGNFETFNEWFLGRNVIRRSGSDLFKGDHLFLPPGALYPSYAYQKVDESKLKPYTRYTVSGFVAQSEHLELVVSRYDKEIEMMLNVPYEEALPISSDNQPNCCKPSSCQCLSCNGSEPDSHFFSYSIDVGALYPGLNPGLEFGLYIVKPNGLASVSNMEIREDRPLTEKEIKKLQRKGKKWKKALEKERSEISAILQPIINQINAFYKNEDWNSTILPHVTYQDLYNVVLPALPKVRHWFMEDREGEHYGILQSLKQAVERVFTQLEEQNLIHNGSFTNGLTNWLVEGDVGITNLGNGNLALQFSHWDASVSQSIDISDFDEDKEYTLRVRGKGKGTITIQHGEEMETMSFDKNDFYFQEQPFYFEEPSFYLQIQSEANEFIVDSIEIIEVLEEDE